MVYSANKKVARIASITNAATCGGNKKAGLMGGVGSVGTGGMSAGRHSKAFCCSARSNSGSPFINTSMYSRICSGVYAGNFSNPSQVAARAARRGMY